MENMPARSGRFVGWGSRRALTAQRDPLEAAEDADERAALGTGIPLGGALFPTAGPALHGIVLVKLGHEQFRR
jgi:hypothetical protein